MYDHQIDRLNEMSINLNTIKSEFKSKYMMKNIDSRMKQLYGSNFSMTKTSEMYSNENYLSDLIKYARSSPTFKPPE